MRPVPLHRRPGPRPLAPDAPPVLAARAVGLVVVLWAAYALVRALLVASDGLPLSRALVSEGLQAVTFAVLSVPSWLLIVRGLDGRPAAWAIAAHAAVLPLYAVFGTGLFVRLLGAVSGPAAEASVRAEFGWIAFAAGVAYAVQFTGYHAVIAARRAHLRQGQAAEALALAREGELRALRAQLHPHFLFNALNAVAADVGHDPVGAREALAALGDLLRYALDSDGRDLVPLADEVAFVEAYLGLEARRMGDRLRVAWDVDRGTLGTAVPPLVIQTLVENAVQHGVAPSRSGGTVAVAVRREAGAVRVSVRDDGVGVPDGAVEPGVGLANADERLRLLFGDGAGLQLAAGPDGGFEAAFQIPPTLPVDTDRRLRPTPSGPARVVDLTAA